MSAICAWKNCGRELPKPIGKGLTPQKFCTPSHKEKARALAAKERQIELRREHPSPPEVVREHIQKSSGYYFAKFMEGAERIAGTHNRSEGAVKDMMIDALEARIRNYRMEADT